jgi:hypothetical protein
MKLDEPVAGGGLPRLDRIIVAGLLLLVAAVAWAFTVHQAILMDDMEANATVRFDLRLTLRNK